MSSTAQARPLNFSLVIPAHLTGNSYPLFLSFSVSFSFYNHPSLCQCPTLWQECVAYTIHPHFV